MNYQWQSGTSSTGPWTDIISATNQTYSPSTSSSGTFFFRVTLSPNVASCNNSSSTVTLNVVNPPTVTCPANSSTCVNTAPYALTGGLPVGGTYSGPGVSGGNFNPATAGVGTHAITYTYTDANSCSNSCSFSITVNPTTTPSVTIAAVPGNNICAGTSVTFTATPTN